MMQEKTFYLQNQQTNQSQVVILKIPSTGTLINVSQLLQHIPRASQKILKIYNPEKDQYIELKSLNLQKQGCTISRDYLKLDVVIIKYCDNGDYLDEFSSEEEDEIKKQRSGERNIKEVIQLVQKWRLYHDDPPDGKRKTLQEAAKIVGVSKKSLDDYYYQLRIGEKHAFDFNAHLNEKIGVLRTFIKIKEPQRKTEGKNAKHPKKLKIIQQFSQKLRITQASSNSNTNSQQLIEIPMNVMTQNKISQIIRKNSIELNHSFDYLNEDHVFFQPLSTPFLDKFPDISENFEDDFNLMLDDPLDSYLPFTDLITKKSNISQDFN